jgi:pimeloyl-ACP methyl ester carboxylesterase
MEKQSLTVNYRTANVSGIKIFYRKAGSPSAPTLLLLDGFPSSSHMFRDLLPLLGEDLIWWGQISPVSGSLRCRNAVSTSTPSRTSRIPSLAFPRQSISISSAFIFSITVLRWFKRDLPKATVQFFDTGHFALETHCRAIAEAIVPFLAKAIGN